MDKETDIIFYPDYQHQCQLYQFPVREAITTTTTKYYSVHIYYVTFCALL